jgi:hypothetical protein
VNALLTTEQLLNYNSIGLIPGPNEDEQSFASRAQYCLDLQKHAENHHAELLMDSWNRDNTIYTNGWDISRKLYGIAPTWVPIAFSNKGLSLWHGGCAWIFTLSENGPRAALLQLRRAFKTQEVYLKLYRRSEIIAHEAAHIGRMAFDEPHFEEMLAYQSSNNWWQRWIGPLFQSARELTLSILMLFAILTVLLLTDAQYTAIILMLVWMGFGTGRLALRHYQLNLCYRHLLTLTKNAEQANALLYRLTDREIITFGKLSPQAIHAYALQQASLSVRWRLLFAAYIAQ